MNQSQVRLVKLLKMPVRTSVLWKMKIHMAKKWPEKVAQRSFIKEHLLPNALYNCKVPKKIRTVCVIEPVRIIGTLE